MSVIDFSNLLVINHDDRNHSRQNYSKNNGFEHDQPSWERARNAIIYLRVSEHRAVVRTKRLNIKTSLQHSASLADQSRVRLVRIVDGSR
jgi:hypothetical protein